MSTPERITPPTERTFDNIRDFNLGANMSAAPSERANEEWERKLKGKKYAEGEASAASDSVFTKRDLPPKHRVISPGMMVTRDMVPDRLNVHLDRTGKCTHCTHG